MASLGLFMPASDVWVCGIPCPRATPGPFSDAVSVRHSAVWEHLRVWRKAGLTLYRAAVGSLRQSVHGVVSPWGGGAQLLGPQVAAAGP